MDVSTLDIIVNKTESSRLNQFDPNNIQFGKLYSDHMLVAIYENQSEERGVGEECWSTLCVWRGQVL